MYDKVVFDRRGILMEETRYFEKGQKLCKISNVKIETLSFGKVWYLIAKLSTKSVTALDFRYLNYKLWTGQGDPLGWCAQVLGGSGSLVLPFRAYWCPIPNSTLNSCMWFLATPSALEFIQSLQFDNFKSVKIWAAEVPNFQLFLLLLLLPFRYPNGRANVIMKLKSLLIKYMGNWIQVNMDLTPFQDTC